ncbi:MAG: sensor histidine kinase [Epsilonproteobacteria bacterium]|nr:sensor histidine kinase [Campylobacterota bacterium]
MLQKINKEYILRIKDSGVGFKNISTTSSLGFTLIKAIATKQFNGEVEIISNKGVEVIVRWKGKS